MNDLKVSTRLIGLIGALAVLVIAIGALGLYGINASNDALKAVYEDRTVPTGQLGRIEALILKNQLALNAALADPSADNVRERTAAIDANVAVVTKLRDAYMATTSRRTRRRSQRPSPTIASASPRRACCRR